MSRVEIQIWDNADNVQRAEADHVDPREAFERAVRMARAALPEKPKEEPGPKFTMPGSYTFEMKNVQFTDVTKNLLFGEQDAQRGFDVRVESDAPPRKPCEAPCPDEDCRDRCARPLGHDDQCTTADGECAWDASAKEPDRCREACGMELCWGDCNRPKDHRGQHHCKEAIDHELCLNEIGAPAATRTCHQPRNHEGECGDA